jgi:cytochrome b6-f complex iron-sulfur subunit
MTGGDEVQVADRLVANRRALLAGGGVACLALLLGACSSGAPAPGGDDGTGADGGASDGDELDQSSLPTPVSQGPPVLAKVSDVPEGGGKVIGAVLLVKISGKIKAYNAHCRHQGFIVDPPENGVIVCENHGSQYRASDGAVIHGPATQGLAVINVQVQGDNIVRA